MGRMFQNINKQQDAYVVPWQSYMGNSSAMRESRFLKNFEGGKERRKVEKEVYLDWSSLSSGIANHSFLRITSGCFNFP